MFARFVRSIHFLEVMVKTNFLFYANWSQIQEELSVVSFTPSFESDKGSLHKKFTASHTKNDLYRHRWFCNLRQHPVVYEIIVIRVMFIAEKQKLSYSGPNDCLY